MGEIKAFIFDLDGVLTQTHELHAKAWQQVFSSFGDFDINSDYQSYIDGRTREEGIKAFLASRGLVRNEHQIRELAEQKNRFFLEMLEQEGPHVIEESVSFLKMLREQNIPMAVVSSSRNCHTILKKAGISDFFKVVVEPHVVEPQSLRSKPYPDYFLHASQILQVAPDACAVIEDSVAGIRAAKAGLFKKVYGLSIHQNTEHEKALQKAGADRIINSLWEVEETSDLYPLPNALTSFEKIFPPGHFKRYFIFLDFDGTLSPIVPDPAEAVPLSGVLELIRECSLYFPIAIITGRDSDVIKRLINLPSLYYAACHGFEITGPENYHYTLEEAQKLKPLFDLAQEHLTIKLGAFPGIVIERKRYGLAFHYRMISSTKLRSTIIETIKDYCLDHPSLRFMKGEEVIELQPRLDWDKGKALLKLYEVLQLDPDDSPPLYCGDGQTDEDAFREMQNWGIPILASEELRLTLARYHLKGPFEIKLFLEKIVQYLHNLQAVKHV